MDRQRITRELVAVVRELMAATQFSEPLVRTSNTGRWIQASFAFKKDENDKADVAKTVRAMTARIERMVSRKGWKLDEVSIVDDAYVWRADFTLVALSAPADDVMKSVKRMRF